MSRFLWGRCAHRSHLLRLPCLRSFHWDGYCIKHTNSCWTDADCAFMQRAMAKRTQRLSAPLVPDQETKDKTQR